MNELKVTGLITQGYTQKDQSLGDIPVEFQIAYGLQRGEMLEYRDAFSEIKVTLWLCIYLTILINVIC